MQKSLVKLLRLKIYVCTNPTETYRQTYVLAACHEYHSNKKCESYLTLFHSRRKIRNFERNDNYSFLQITK